METTPADGVRPSWVARDDRQSTYFLSTNRNKESITLDLKALTTSSCCCGWSTAPT